MFSIIDTPKHETKNHGEITDIESVVVHNEEKEELTIFAVNRNLKEDVSLESEVSSFDGYQVLEHIVLEHDDLKARNSAGIQNVRPKSGGQSKKEDAMVISLLHKASWNVIRLGKGREL